MVLAETHVQLAGELLELEVALRNLCLWSSEPPSAKALASVEPFACDAMAFTEWLQYIFIPRFSSLLENGDRLPEKCEITPMAEEYFKSGHAGASLVLIVLSRIDRLVTDNA